MISTESKSSKEVVDKIIKGNIPIKKDLLNKYENTKEIFEKENYALYSKLNINVDSNILDGININNITDNEAKYIAKKLFHTYHYNNKFVNDDKEILVFNSGINESITKVKTNLEQKQYLLEHFIVFANLGYIIEHAKLVNQTLENKGRTKYKIWNYYFDRLIISKKEYLLEFDVVSMENGENHYRVQKLKKIDISRGDINYN